METEPVVYLDIFSRIRTLYEEQRFTDITIMVENQSFPCHRIILSAASRYFDAMFSSNMKESEMDEIYLHDIKANTFKDVLAFVYCNKDIITQETAEDIIRTASMLQIDSLQKQCERFMAGNINIENCVGLWALARHLNYQKLKEKSYPCILSNFVEVCENEEFLLLEKNDLIEIIKDDGLKVIDEDVVCEAVFKWIRFDECSRKHDLPEIFQHLRLTQVSIDYVLDELDTNPLVTEFKSCVIAVKNAIKYHAMPARRQTLTNVKDEFRCVSNKTHLITVLGRRYRKGGETSLEFIGYNIKEKKWVSLHNHALPYDIGEDFAVCSFGDDIFVTGGTKTMETCLRYSSKFSQWRERSKLCKGRYRHAMVAVKNSLYVIGGYNFGTLSCIEEYDMGIETWKKVGELQHGVDATSAAAIGDNLYVFGGWLGFAQETAAIQCFETKTKTSYQIGTLPHPCKYTRAISVNNRIQIISPQGELISFSPNDGSKIISTVKDFSRRNFGVFVNSDGVHIFGGEKETSTDSAEGDICDDVILVTETQSEKLKSMKLPVPMEVYGCIRTVVDKKYSLVDFQKTLLEFDI